MKLEKHTIAWHFHQNTCRWRYNTITAIDQSSPIAPYKEYPDCPSYPLPEPELANSSLKEVIENRHSCRDFLNQTITQENISTILKYAYGVHQSIYLNEEEFFERPVPSGGGLYPLELYILLRNVTDIPQGVYHYCVTPPCLEQISQKQLSDVFISQLFMNQFYLAHCGCVVVITSSTERNMWKYDDRGYRYILFEAGHVAQNVNLVAQSLGLGSLNLGGFFDHEMAKLLKIDIDVEVPLYAVALGKPSSGSKEKSRIPQGLSF